MKNWFKSPTTRTFIIVLLALVVFNTIATLNNSIELLQVSKALMIPLFFSIYFIKNKVLNNIFIAFLICAFIGDLFAMLPNNAVPFKITSVAYFCSYSFLIAIGLFKMKTFQFNGLVGAYLVAVFLLNAYFMFSFYGLMSNNISDAVELLFTTLQIIALLVLGFIAFAGYLGEDGRQSILFLLMSFSLIFAKVLSLIETYYITYEVFIALEWVAYTTTLILFYNYLVGYNRIKKKKSVRESISIREEIAA